MTLTVEQLDRAIGAVLASAAGDALGAPYEFGPPLPPEARVWMHSNGVWEVGEWTDDTSMAVPVLTALADGRSLGDPAALAAVVAEWRDWARTAKDVGIQTREALGRLRDDDLTEAAAAAAARAVHELKGRSAGNGSLMRTGPIALGYLGGEARFDAPEAVELASVARRVSALTHYAEDAGDGCVIWSLAIRHAILSGELEIRGAIDTLRPEQRAIWHERIDVAERLEPVDMPGGNGWVVAALQAAWSSLRRSSSLREAIDRAVRVGNDTDTVAAITGSLGGAVHGASEVPAEWREPLHGWPGIDVHELVRRAEISALRFA